MTAASLSLSLSRSGLFSGFTRVSPTVANDPWLEFIELANYKFHVRDLGDKALPAVIVVHGGPGGDSNYLHPIADLSKKHRVVFYDQRGTGLSARVDKEALTLQSSLDDLHRIVSHYAGDGQVKLIGHSWGAMLVVGYLARHPEKVSHAVVVEPGILHPDSAVEFVRRFKASQSIWDALPLAMSMLLAPFVASHDGHERNDFVMTRLNRVKPGGPYQCAGETMPANAFERAGFAAFDNMLKPVLRRPETFTHDLTLGLAAFKGRLLLLSSQCSSIGHAYQQAFHMPAMPAQTVHLQAKAMGHNLLTLHPAWSVAIMETFFGDSPGGSRARPHLPDRRGTRRI
jgi:proline iminopeptidase